MFWSQENTMKTTVKNLWRYKNRRGATVVYMAMMLVLLFGMAAFAIEVGMMMVARTNLQSAADSAALAGASVLAKGKTETMVMAKQYAAYHHYMGEPVQLADEDIQVGFWDPAAVIFTEDVNGNAVRVITRINNSRLVFGALLGTSEFSAAASSVAVAPARDIVFVVDLSGSICRGR
jgi:Flp pilus assembly protein TadG